METKPIPGAPNYAATSDGKIINAKNGRVLRTYKAGGVDRDYEYVMLSSKGPRGSVHRFVCAAFHGPPPFPKAEAAHIDGDTTNNRPGNLAWKTRAQNEADKKLHGTDNRPIFQGSDHPRAKLTDADVDDIRKRGGPTKVLVAQYGVDQSTIRRIVRGVAWRSGQPKQQKPQSKSRLAKSSSDRSMS